MVAQGERPKKKVEIMLFAMAVEGLDLIYFHVGPDETVLGCAVEIIGDLLCCRSDLGDDAKVYAVIPGQKKVLITSYVKDEDGYNIH